MSSWDWVACPNCGYPNRPDARAAHRGCLGCFHDAVSGRRDAAQASNAAGLLLAVYLLCGMLGVFFGVIVGAMVSASVGATHGSAARDLLITLFSGFGAGIAMRIAWRNQMRRALWGPAPKLPLPPGADPKRRRAKLMGHIFIGVSFMFWTFIFTVGRLTKGAEAWVGSLAIIALPVTGALGGWLWYRFGPKERR